MTNIFIPARFRCGPISFNTVSVHSSKFSPPAWIPGQCYMPYPDARGQIVWEGGEFGLTTSTGATGTSAQVSVTHRVSDPSAFSSVTAQLYIGSTPVGNAASFTLSNTYVTETVKATTGINSGNIASLKLKLTWEQVAMGIAYVNWAQARTPVSVSSSGLLSIGVV